MSEKHINAKALSEKEKELCQMVDEHKEELIQLLKDLIKFPSITYSPEKHSELHDIFDFAKKFMDEAGYTSETYECPHKNDETKTWPNLVSYFEDKTEKDTTPFRSLQFLGHLDVVPYFEEKWDNDLDPLNAVIKDGRVYGRGTADMKGGIAAQMMACKLFKQANIPMTGKLQMWFVPDEEINGHYGAQFMAKKYKQVVDCDGTIISEPTGQPPIQSPAIILGEKGHQWLKIKVYGASGHGSMPKPKSNAINKAVHFVSKSNKMKLPKVKAPLSPWYLLKGLLKRFSLKNLISAVTDSDGDEPDPYDEDGVGLGAFFSSTISFTQMHAGTKVNVIPDYCEMECDIRILPGISSQDVFDSLANYATKLGYRMELPKGFKNPQKFNKKIQKRPVDLEVSIIGATEGTFVDPDQKFIQLLADAFEDVYEVRAVHFFAPGSTDAVHMRKEGIDNVVVFGPSGSHTHDANESVIIKHLVNTCKVYLVTAYRILSENIL